MPACAGLPNSGLPNSRLVLESPAKDPNTIEEVGDIVDTGLLAETAPDIVDAVVTMDGRRRPPELDMVKNRGEERVGELHEAFGLIKAFGD